MFIDSVENSVSWNVSFYKSHSDFSQDIIYLDLALSFILVPRMFKLPSQESTFPYLANLQVWEVSVANIQQKLALIWQLNSLRNLFAESPHILLHFRALKNCLLQLLQTTLTLHKIDIRMTLNSMEEDAAQHKCRGILTLCHSYK